MKLQFKLLIIVIPFVLLSLLTLGLWSFNEAKKTNYLSNYRFLSIVLESYTAESLHQNYQQLKDAKMDKVVSYVESYKQDAINRAKILTKARGGNILIVNDSGELIFCTQGFNSANVESSWKEISKRIVDEDSAKIIKGHIDKKPYDDLYVAQYFKPWDWVVFYSIPNEDINALVNKIRLITLVISFLCALVSSFLIFLFSNKYLLKPIAKLKKVAQNITTHKQFGTIPINSKDELGLLARSMETMSKSITLYKTERKHAEKLLIEKHEELQKNQLELKQHQESLEQLVDERTVELKKSEKQFKTIITKSPLPMVITDQNQNISLFNDKFTELFGYTVEDVSTAEKWWEIAYPDEKYRAKVQNSWMVAIEKANVNKTDIEMQEWELTIKNRTKRSCEFYMVPLEDVSIIILNDITERKKIQEDLKRQALAMDNSSDTIVITDTSGIIHYVNPAFKKITGYDNKEVLGKDLSILKSGVHDAQFYEELWDTISGGEIWSGQFTNKKKDGSEYIEEATISPVFSKEGEIINYVAVKRDITDRLELEIKLRQSQKMESIGTLAGGIAHDFNNIMAIIVGNTELALDDVPKWNSAHSSLEEIKKASLRAKDIVKQLLSFSRKTDQKLQPIQIASVIKEALQFLRSTIPTTINIHRDIQTTEEMILADPTQINQIIMNLCINASHAMEQTGGDLTVTVEKVFLDNQLFKDYPDLKSGDHVKIIVSDTGPGIDLEIIDQIFDPYFTTKEVGKGSGMGLAVVHGIVKSHGGAIAVDSSLGKGTKFTMFFPLATEKPMVDTKTIQEIPRGNETILFVDDEISIVKMVQRMFERLGYKVETATTPQDALEQFSSNPAHFDLVITDMTMPQMTGVKLSEKLMDIRKDIPIIICTGHSTLVDEEKAKELGLAAYVMKPINMLETAQTIRKVLDRKQSPVQG